MRLKVYCPPQPGIQQSKKSMAYLAAHGNRTKIETVDFEQNCAKLEARNPMDPSDEFVCELFEAF